MTFATLRSTQRRTPWARATALVATLLGSSAFADEPFQLTVPELSPSGEASTPRADSLAQRLVHEVDARTLDALKQEFADETFHLPVLLRASGLMYFKIVTLSEADGADTHSATYIAQYADETFECGEIAWAAGEARAQVRRHDRRFFTPNLLRDADARARLQTMGCL